MRVVHLMVSKQTIFVMLALFQVPHLSDLRAVIFVSRRPDSS
jgi:hypothetical protein